MVAQLDPAYIKMSPTNSLVRLLSYAFFEGRPLTTRGRWFNPVVNAHLRFARHFGSRDVVHKPVFIIGMGRSGTTILGVVLSMHHQVAFLNEPKAMWHLVHPHEDVIGNYTNELARYRLSEADATPNAIEAAQRMYGYYLMMTRRERVVDKYPELVFRVPFVRALFPDAKFVFLSRNGWDACSSIEGWSQRFRMHGNGEVHDWWGRNRRKWSVMLDELILPDASLAQLHATVKEMNDDRSMAVVEWIVTMREGMRVAREHPESILTVRYEDLVASPHDKLKEIACFCDLEPDNRYLTYGKEVLKSSRARTHFELPSAISEVFDETMVQLGYM